MKKKTLRILAMLLCAAMLTGCGLSEDALVNPVSFITELFGYSEKRDELCPFNEMEYERPSLEELDTRVLEVEHALRDGESLKRVKELITLCYDEYEHFSTMRAIADIRACQNTADSYYASEYEWCNTNYYQEQQLMDELYYACAKSELAGKLEKELFWEGFADEYNESDDTNLGGNYFELKQREAELIAQYRSILAEPVIELYGESGKLSDFLDMAGDEDYYYVMDAYYEQYNPKLAEVYIELVKLRNSLARSMGYESYEQMQYRYNYNRDYEPEQAEEYLQDIRTYIVPLYKEVMEADPYSRIEYDFMGAGELMRIMRTVVGGMGGSVEEAFAFMEEYGLYDVEYRENKSSTSFQTYMQEYEAPFLFVSPYEEAEDLMTVAHEFGHYADAYINYSAYETVDLSECYSQAMELLLLNRLDGIMKERDLENLYRIKMLDTLEMYIQQSSLADFEEQVYAMDEEELSAERLNELALQLTKDYGYAEGQSETYLDKSWIDIYHFFEQPFYIISYPVSNDIAMQIYELEMEEEGAGLKKLLDMLPRVSDKMIASAELAGLQSPFDAGRIQKTTEDLRLWLE